MSKLKEFLVRKDIVISPQRYLIDALGAMAQGLFASLLIGTIIKTVGQQTGLALLVDLGGYATAMSGPAMACAIGWALHCPPLVLFSLITVGYSANALGGAGGPLAVLIIAIVAVLGPGIGNMYLAMWLVGWTSYARLVRSAVMVEKNAEYVQAARTLGYSHMRILFRHILPNVLSLILVTATLDFATCMLTESTLSYLGFGISPPTPTWGNMLTGANNSIVIQQYWWRWVFPAAIFGICTICINLVGDALRDAVDPKSAER